MKKRTRLTEDQKNKIIKEYNNGTGKFIREIARELNIYPQVIKNFLTKNKIPIRKRWNPQKRDRWGKYGS